MIFSEADGAPALHGNLDAVAVGILHDALVVAVACPAMGAGNMRISAQEAAGYRDHTTRRG